MEGEEDHARPVADHVRGHQAAGRPGVIRSEEHTSELQSLRHLVCRLLLENKKLCLWQLRGRSTEIGSTAGAVEFHRHNADMACPLLILCPLRREDDFSTGRTYRSRAAPGH